MRRRLWTSLALMCGLLVVTAASAQTTGTTGTTGQGTTGLGQTGTTGLGQTGQGGFGQTGQGGFGQGGQGGLGQGGQGGQSGQGIGATGTFTESSLIGQSSLANSGTTNANSVGGSSLLGKNYVYPQSKGLPTQALVGTQAGSTAVAFGQPLYTVPAAGTATTGARGAAGTRMGAGGQGTATATMGQGTFASSAGQDRIVPYVTELGFTPNLASPTVVGRQVQSTLSNSTRLSNNGVQVITQPDGIVLRGQATNDRERAVMEAMARLTPGVRAVRNEIIVPGR